MINIASDKKELNWAVLGTGVIANQMASALHDMDRQLYGVVIIPGLFEPPVRTLRATIPENESHIFR